MLHTLALPFQWSLSTKLLSRHEDTREISTVPLLCIAALITDLDNQMDLGRETISLSRNVCLPHSAILADGFTFLPVARKHTHPQMCQAFRSTQCNMIFFLARESPSLKVANDLVRVVAEKPGSLSFHGYEISRMHLAWMANTPSTEYRQHLYTYNSLLPREPML